MAKLTANGHRKLATFTTTLPEGYELYPGYVLDTPLEIRHALRSDGRVLKSHRDQGARWSGWTVTGTLKDADTVEQMRTRFAQLRDLWVTKHGDSNVSPIES